MEILTSLGSVREDPQVVRENTGLGTMPPSFKIKSGAAIGAASIMEKIQSFRINHDVLEPGIYVSRIDGDITTYDLRTRKPNAGDYMDVITMHSVEHMIATLIRNSEMASDIIYFGPMGCQTGFYLLVRNADNEKVLAVLKDCLKKTLAYEGPVFGASAAECGNSVAFRLKRPKRSVVATSRFLKISSTRTSNIRNKT